jgi:hypothetical protein
VPKRFGSIEAARLPGGMSAVCLFYANLLGRWLTNDIPSNARVGGDAEPPWPADVQAGMPEKWQTAQGR